MTVVNCSILGNHASDGGAIETPGNSLVLVNTLIAFNDSGVFHGGTGGVTLSHCNVYGNGSYNFSGLPDPTGTDGNISQDPLLSSTTRDIHLQPGSPCIDAGDDSAVTPGETDIYGKPRTIGAHVDIGADESDGTTWPSPLPVIWHVSPSGSNGNDGTSWATARKNLPFVLATAQPGDEVWVATGTYQERLTLWSDIGVYGGFAGTETQRDQRDPAKNATILDRKDVTIPASATSKTVLDGFTIQNVGGLGAGGGMYIYGGTPVISHNLFLNDSVGAVPIRTGVSYGGGIYIESGMPLIQGNTFSGCSALFGGAIYGTGGVIRDNLFASNTATQGYAVHGTGGAIYLTGRGVVVHNLFVNNTSSYGCGGALCSYSVVADNVFQDNYGGVAGALEARGTCTVVRNTITCATQGYGPSYQAVFGGGVFSDNLIAAYYGSGLNMGHGFGSSQDSSPVIANNTIVGVGMNPGIAVWSEYSLGVTPSFTNNIVMGWQVASDMASREYTPVVTTNHNDIYGNLDNTLSWPGASQIGENGNISVDPLFVNPSGWDYHLKAGSPCIDAGNDAYVKSGDRDVEGRPRISGAHVDIGAYEYGSPLYTVQDAATVLRIAAGMSPSTPADLSRLDVAGETGLTVTDATRIAQWLLN